jgi:hypothetical protein
MRLPLEKYPAKKTAHRVTQMAIAVSSKKFPIGFRYYSGVNPLNSCCLIKLNLSM